jgi:hypothetical protein
MMRRASSRRLAVTLRDAPGKKFLDLALNPANGATAAERYRPRERAIADPPIN